MNGVQARGWPVTSGYVLRLAGFFVFCLTVALLSVPALLGGLFTVGLLYPPCGSSRLTPADYGYPWEDVTIPARPGGSFRGYFIPGSNGATIIVPPPWAGGRDSRLRQAAVLLRHGFSVLTFESRRCAGLGPLSLGYREVEEVADTLDYLRRRPEVDPDRIGIHGFSSAGATAVMAAARLPALRAVVAEGGYGDFAEETLTPRPGHGPVAYFETVYFGSIKLTYRLITGLDINRLSPTDVIDQIAPRPILLIYGSREVSLVGARHQQAAAGGNATLWIVEGAGHGNYLEIAPEEYETRLVEFFDSTLK
ncbi:MAG: CocE/NonD family hydrolase [Chloroflexota bacterium]